MKNKFNLIILIQLLSLTSYAQRPVPSAYSPSSTINFIRTWESAAPEVNSNTLVTRSVKDVRQTTAYFDGLGRPLQTVLKQGSMYSGQSATDLVMPVVYDSLGREVYKYLPYADSSESNGLFKLSPFQQQASFYDNANPKSPIVGQGELWFYQQTIMEASPLNRALKTLTPGNSWVGSNKGVEVKYFINTVADSVRKWNVTDLNNGWGAYASIDNYAVGDLYKTISVDENGKQQIEFKDKEGRVLLKKVQLSGSLDSGNGIGYTGWLCTYYIYDDLGNLRCVIQPRGVELLAGSGWTITTTILNEQCFRYEYDYRSRMVMKKVPGAGQVWMVYDGRDRLVLTQDSALRYQGKWLYTTYDNLNRPVATGLWNNTQDRVYHSGQAVSSTSYPNLSGQTYEELTKSFYDDYSWLAANGNPFSSSSYNTGYDTYLQSASNQNWPYAQANSQTVNLKGLATGTKVKVLGTSTYLYSMSIYDEKARIIQVQSKNITGGTDIATTQYSWSGQVLVSIQKQDKAVTNAQTSVVITQLTYDDLWRLVKAEKKLGNTFVSGGSLKGFVTIFQNEYDKLGQLKRKRLEPGYNNNAGLDSLTYEYNIRGWLLGVNRDYARDGNNNNYFGFDLGYDKVNNNLVGGQTYQNAQYNGNISGMVWKSKGDGEKRKYDFTYDAVNRLTGADFNQYTSSSFNKTAGVDFSVSGLSYDANGNIMSMRQKGLKINSSPTIDSLSYVYQSSSNKLAKVTDAFSDANTKLGDFKDGTNGSSDDYSYDGNGNLVLDNNKGISSIVYNHLNLPSVIKINGKGTITYSYDATGAKISKVTVDSTASPVKTTTTLYLGVSVYLNDTLQFIGQEEGRIRPLDTTFAYDYFLKDHLGNVRMMLTDEQKTDMYPAATMEAADSTLQQKYYSNLSTTRVGVPSGYPANTPAGNARVAKVGASTGTNKIGPAIVLKVMAGDKFNLAVNSWWKSTNTPQTPVSPLNDLLSALSGGIGAVSGTHGTSTELTNTGVLSPGATSFLGSQSYNSAKPKAFVSWVLFDEQFKFVSSSSGSEQVSTSDNYYSHSKLNMPIDRSGYLYIYVSNETPNIDVYFDNLQVTHIRGRMLEENHYYPFGLTMNGISSKAENTITNRYKFNCYEQNIDFDIYTYESLYRTNDPQIGRFWQVDPKPTDDFSPYASMQDNPLWYADPLGDIVRNAHDEEVQVAVARSNAARETLSKTEAKYGVAQNNVSKKTFLASGHTKSEWKEFKSVEKNYEKANARTGEALRNQFEAQEDINQMQFENKTLFNVINNLSIDIFIGRTENSNISVDAGGGANIFGMDASGVIQGRMYNLDDLNDGTPQFRPGIAIWIQTGRGQYSTVKHETGHAVSMYGGVPALGIGGIPYGTAGNPNNITDYVRNYAAAWGGGCVDCRSTPSSCNPSSAAAVAAENLPRESATKYVRATNPYR